MCGLGKSGQECFGLCTSLAVVVSVTDVTGFSRDCSCLISKKLRVLQFDSSLLKMHQLSCFVIFLSLFEYNIVGYNMIKQTPI